MKRFISLLITACMLFALYGCGSKPAAEAEKPQAEETQAAEQQEEQKEEAQAAPEDTAQAAGTQAQAAELQEDAQTAGTQALPAAAAATGWKRQGFFEDENNNMISITWMDDIDEPGWYVGCMLGEDMVEDSYGGTLQPEEGSLHGILPSSGEKEGLTVTVTEEGEDGLLLAVEGGGTYHFKPMEMEEAKIFVNINTEGFGSIAYAEGETTPEFDPEYPYQSAVINLGEPAVHTLAAAPEAGSLFVKWTKNGEDFSTEPQITLLLDESAEYIAVFEEDPDWQNPVMNFIGEYQCDRAHALIECESYQDARITIDWGGSASESAHWDISGRLNLDTLTIEYFGAAKRNITYGEGGDVVNEEMIYGDGTGRITFNDDGTFTWHEDQSETGEDMVFEFMPVQ